MNNYINTQKETTQVNYRESAFEKFRSLSSGTRPKGDTLSSAAPTILPTTKAFMSKRLYMMRLAYRETSKVAATSLLIPSEICWAADFIPFNWEMFASVLATNPKVTNLTNKGSYPVPRCSFINTLKGAHMQGVLPSPNVTLSSSAFCEGIGFLFSEMADEFKVPPVHIDIPGFTSKENIAQCGMQIESAYNQLCDVNEIPEEKREERFRKAMFYSTLAKLEYSEICEIRKQNAPLNLGLEPLHWHFLLSTVWGEESTLDLCKKLKKDIIEHVSKHAHTKDSGIPLGIFALIPYGRTPIWEKLIKEKAYTTFEGVNYLGDSQLLSADEIHELPVSKLFENLAYNLIKSPVRGLEVKDKLDTFMKEAADTGAKGMILFSHEHCQMLASRMNEIESTAVDNNLKFVGLGGDVILGMPQGPTNIRLDTFLASFKDIPKPQKADKANNQNNKPETNNGIRVGIDFGSGFSKYVIIDNEHRWLQHGIFNSGIDYVMLLDNIKRKLFKMKDYKIGISGVGGDNPNFSSLANHQTTEINALITAVRHIFDSETLLVIDIGTQDVKVLLFDDMSRAPWVNTNKSCGAGTGMVLVQILERWKQTEPDITFEMLDNMALEATQGEVINTTCGIFAVTNVVSALVQADEEGRKNILKGVYQYVATQALKLLPANLNTKNHPLLLTGGIAKHKSLQKIFDEMGFELLKLPEHMKSQHVVAYGTALSIN